MKRFLQPSLTLFLIVTAVSCSNQTGIKNISTRLLKHKYFPQLSSASGVGFFEGKIYLVGDDLPYLFQLDENWNIINKQKISGIDSLVNGRSPKQLKADFESLAIFDEAGEKQLLILSSGSKKPSRDTAFLLSLSGNGVMFKKNMRPVYHAIKQAAGMKPENKINIEGLAFSEDKVYLLHRGNISGNLIIEIERDQLIAFIQGKTDLLPGLSVFRFKLPGNEGVSAGFSGACVLPGQPGLLFTASLEKTNNEIDDGAVLGSYLGFVPFATMKEGKFISKLITEKGNPLQKKQEGITVQSINGNKITVLTVCDNDNGSSDLFEIELRINQE
jgi:hypothetical protein